MSYIKNIFKSVDTSYLIKSYIISISLTALLLGNTEEGFQVFYLILTAILFPFSALVWDELVHLMMGNTIFFLPLPILLVWKLAKISLLYCFAILIAPLGILYIIIRNNSKAY